MPSNIQRVHEHDQALRIREELSVLYVALTRAVHSLQMIIAPSQQAAACGCADQPVARRDSESKKLPRTVAGLIRAALTDHQSLEPNQVVFELGDRILVADCCRKIGLAAAEVGRSHRRRLSAAADEVSTQRARHDAAVRPSMLEGGGHVRLLDRLSLPGQLAMQRGSLIHAFFEQIEWIETGLPSGCPHGDWPALDTDPEHLQYRD